MLTSLHDVLPIFAILILSLSVHEAAHAWVADRLGDPTSRQLGRITLNPLSHIDPIGTVLFPLVALWSGLPLIGWAKPVPVNMRNLRAPRRDFALVALAGPVSNLLIAVVAATLFGVFEASGVEASNQGMSTVVDVVLRTVVLNVLLAVFNMIPVPPLDGGNVLAGFAPEPVARAIDALRPHGFLILYGLMFSGVLDRFVSPVQFAILRWLL